MLLSVIGNAILVPVVLFYLLVDWPRLVDHVRELVPPRLRESAFGFFGECDQMLGQYLRGQLVIGINPDPREYDGVLCRHRAKFAMPLLLFACTPRGKDAAFTIQERCMALARREDGQELRSLNEIFIGHASHQSARYRITFGALKERHSSSGVIVATGTGCTGWARSIAEQRHLAHPLPVAADARLAWFVREPPTQSAGDLFNYD